MGKENWLNIIAQNHKEWIKIVRSFGEINYAEDIVQETYLALYKYASKEKIIKNGVVSKGYMYITLRSIYYQFYNKKHKIQKLYLDDIHVQLYDESNIKEQKAFHKICLMIDDEIDKWHWYDKVLFKTYRDTDLSIRRIAKETKISWVSIFNTLKNSKNIIKHKFSEDWEDYKNEDFEKL
jgi:DNA-directed RNA polymerase specialized sigma24 family protein